MRETISGSIVLLALLGIVLAFVGFTQELRDVLTFALTFIAAMLVIGVIATVAATAMKG